MEAFLGSWKSSPQDTENVEAYAKALNQPQLVKEMEGGSETTVSKDGDNYVFSSKRDGGAGSMDQILYKDGSVKFNSETIPSDIVKVTHRIEGGKLILEGTVGGVETKSVMAIQDGKMVLELTTMGATMKSTSTKA